MVTKVGNMPRIKGKSHHVGADFGIEPVISYDQNKKPKTLQLKGLGMNHASAYQIKMEVDRTVRLFNYKKK